MRGQGGVVFWAVQFSIFHKMKFSFVLIAAIRLVSALPRHAEDYDLDYEEYYERPTFYQAANHNLQDDQLTARQGRIRQHAEQSEGSSLP